MIAATKMYLVIAVSSVPSRSVIKSRSSTGATVVAAIRVTSRGEPLGRWNLLIIPLFLAIGSDRRVVAVVIICSKVCSVSFGNFLGKQKRNSVEDRIGVEKKESQFSEAEIFFLLRNSDGEKQKEFHPDAFTCVIAS